MPGIRFCRYTCRPWVFQHDNLAPAVSWHGRLTQVVFAAMVGARLSEALRDDHPVAAQM